MGAVGRVRIDTECLRSFLEDYVGTAAASGWPAAITDLVDVEGMSDEELCEMGEELGVLQRFAK